MADMLRLAGVGEFAWAGPWPPPERLGVAVGNRSGHEVVFDPDDLPEDAPPLELVERHASTTYFRRVSYSDLPFEDARVIRGASYEREEE